MFYIIKKIKIVKKTKKNFVHKKKEKKFYKIKFIKVDFYLFIDKK